MAGHGRALAGPSAAQRRYALARLGAALQRSGAAKQCGEERSVARQRRSGAVPSAAWRCYALARRSDALADACGSAVAGLG